LKNLPHAPEHLVEAFAGGAGVGLTALSTGLINHLTLVELDPDVANLWQVVFSDSGEDLAAYISTVTTPASAHRIMQLPCVDKLDRALHTLIHNRLSFNGIRAAGAGMLGTPNGAPASSWSFNPATLARRIRAPTAHRVDVTVIHDDALAVLPSFATAKGTAFYLDPPYSAAGNFASRLYPYWRLNHERLMKVASGLEGPFLLSHQDAPVVHRLASKYGFGLAEVTPVPKTRELLMSRDLRWLKEVTRPFKLLHPGPLRGFNIDLSLLPAFVVVAEKLHFARAAKRLNIAAPALFQQIKRLETQLGTLLFERTTRRVALTQSGQALRGAVSSPLTAIDLFLAGG
jgi:DNA adenine methylase